MCACVCEAPLSHADALAYSTNTLTHSCFLVNQVVSGSLCHHQAVSQRHEAGLVHGRVALQRIHPRKARRADEGCGRCKVQGHTRA